MDINLTKVELYNKYNNVWLSFAYFIFIVMIYLIISCISEYLDYNISEFDNIKTNINAKKIKFSNYELIPLIETKKSLILKDESKVINYYNNSKKKFNLKIKNDNVKIKCNDFILSAKLYNYKINTNKTTNINHVTIFKINDNIITIYFEDYYVVAELNKIKIKHNISKKLNKKSSKLSDKITDDAITKLLNLEV